MNTAVYKGKDGSFTRLAHMTGFEFIADAAAIDKGRSALEDLGKVTVEGTFTVLSGRSTFAYLARAAQQYECLRRQHKAKGRGKNWRAVPMNARKN